ncbi:MAG: hypothetical protein SOZ59_13570 [Candidatus Limivivens sp.]|nr:hypothetical protein [Candidatus Limivivens sp.]
MRRGYAIGILLCMVFMGAVYTMTFHFTGQEYSGAPMKEETEPLRENETAFRETEREEESEFPEEQPVKEAVSSGKAETGLYYLKGEKGLVTVYRGDKKTLYERTAIPVESLPEILRLEVSLGKMLKTEQELYSFLENYSS